MGACLGVSVSFPYWNWHWGCNHGLCFCGCQSTPDSSTSQFRNRLQALKLVAAVIPNPEQLVPRMRLGQKIGKASSLEIEGFRADGFHRAVLPVSARKYVIQGEHTILYYILYYTMLYHGRERERQRERERELAIERIAEVRSAHIRNTRNHEAPVS